MITYLPPKWFSKDEELCRRFIRYLDFDSKHALNDRMHDIEPYFLWREKYDAAADTRSPFYGREYSEFFFSNKVYNYLIHPQWDDFGSPTLYAKILYTDYAEGYAILEFIGEWNDCIQNDIMILLENVLQPLLESGVSRYVLILENVLNFHASDDCYYQEWHEELIERGGWLSMINLHPHVFEEMRVHRLDYYARLHSADDYLEWRHYTPKALIGKLEEYFSMARLLD